MKRPTQPWIPTFGEVEGAAANLCRKNLWRVAPLYEFDDLMQEARLKFLYVQLKYPRVIDPPHFMVLFLRSFTNHLHRLAAARGRSASGHVEVGGLRGKQVQADREQSDPIASLPSRDAGVDLEEQFERRIEQASPEIQALVRGVSSSTRRPKLRRRYGQRETTNSFLCRLAGVNPGEVNLRVQLDAFLNESSAAVV